MQGIIVKGIAGFYYVYVAGSGIYECKAKGIFRREKIKPLAGDRVEMEVTHEGDREGNITKILPRKNTLVRPPVANIDQALVVFAASSPEPNFFLLDRFLVSMEYQDIPCVICFNKQDIGEEEKIQSWIREYQAAGYKAISCSVKNEEGIRQVFDLLRGKTSTVAGPSGVGKSSLINRLVPDAKMETGELSQKIQRGKNTTRHSELLKVEEDTFILDTPGFTSLYLPEIGPEALRDYFPEFAPYQEECRFRMCRHASEPGCAVKQAVEEGKVSKGRYEHYLAMLEELQQKKKY